MHHVHVCLLFFFSDITCAHAPAVILFSTWEKPSDTVNEFARREVRDWKLLHCNMKTSLLSSSSVPMYSPSMSPSLSLSLSLSVFSSLSLTLFSLFLIFLPQLFASPCRRRRRLSRASSSTLVNSDGFLDISLWEFYYYFLYFKETRL